MLFRMSVRARPYCTLFLGLLLSAMSGCRAPGTSHESVTGRAFEQGVHRPDPGARVEPDDEGVVGDTDDGGASSLESADDEPLLPDDDAGLDEPRVAAVDGGPPASAYAALDRDACEAALTTRGIAFDRVSEARGVLAPVRLAGPLSGVTFRSNLPPQKSRSSPYDIYDCRLVLALDDFARILSRHGIVEVVHLSVYRPASRKTKLRGLGRRHTGALAIDAAIFRTSDGRSLTVEKDFQPRRRGARPCPAPSSASELRRIACEAGDARLFNVLLTPNFNRAHYNHFHLEVTANVRWTLVR